MPLNPLGQVQTRVWVPSCDPEISSITWAFKLRSYPPPPPPKHSLFLLCPEIRLDDESVHGKVDDQGGRSGVENRARQQLVCQVNGEEICLAGPVQPEMQEQKGGGKGQLAGKDGYAYHHPRGPKCSIRTRGTGRAWGETLALFHCSTSFSLPKVL